MKETELRQLATPMLVKLFEEIALAQDKANLYDEYAHYNKLFRQMTNISRELKSRPGDQRRSLSSLYKHPNAQVRLKAAIHTLALVPAEARAVLQIISDRNEYPPAADARGMLSALDEGRYVPD